MIRHRRLLVGRLGGNLFDQALSAISNVVLAVVVARSVDAEGFGAFSIAFVVYGITFAARKAIVGQPLQIRHSASGPDELRRHTADAAGATVTIAVGLAVITALSGVALGGSTGDALLALGVWLPCLLLQDCCRMAFFAADRPWSSAAIDATWALVQFPLLAWLILSGQTSMWALIGAWGMGAGVSALVGLMLLQVVPQVGRALRWIRGQAQLAGYLFAEYVLGLGAAQVSLLIVAVMIGEAGVGSLRAAQVLLGPLGILGTAAFQFSVPEVARSEDRSPGRMRRFAASISGGLLVLHLAYVTVLLLMPQSLGVQLFGDSWAGANVVLLAMAVASCFSCLANGPAGVLYGLGWARSTFRVNLFKGPLLLLAVPLATSMWQANGAAWALAAVEATILPFWVVTLIRATRIGRLTTTLPSSTLATAQEA